MGSFVIGQHHNLIDFYHEAKRFCIAQGYEYEIKAVRERKFADCDAEEFFCQYIYVILNSGMNNQWAEKKYELFFKNNLDVNIIRHPSKHKATERAIVEYGDWFEKLKSISDEMEKLTFLDSLPFIGKITKYHLARNLGLDVAKPDRHLVRLSAQFGFVDVQEMCTCISQTTGDRIGVVDVVLWRNENLKRRNSP